MPLPHPFTKPIKLGHLRPSVAAAAAISLLIISVAACVWFALPSLKPAPSAPPAAATFTTTPEPLAQIEPTQPPCSLTTTDVIRVPDGWTAYVAPQSCIGFATPYENESFSDFDEELRISVCGDRCNYPTEIIADFYINIRRGTAIAPKHNNEDGETGLDSKNKAIFIDAADVTPIGSIIDLLEIRDEDQQDEFFAGATYRKTSYLARFAGKNGWYEIDTEIYYADDVRLESSRRIALDVVRSLILGQ
jgi:hypothetical protein